MLSVFPPPGDYFIAEQRFAQSSPPKAQKTRKDAKPGPRFQAPPQFDRPEQHV